MKQRSVFEITTRRPIAILMIVIAVSVFGFVSYKKLPLALMPNIAYPSLTIRTEYPGTAPQEVETQVSQRLEQQLAIISELESISSISRAEQSDIIMEFAWGADISEATQEIREKLDRVRLPNEATRPLILRYDPTLDPIMRIGVASASLPLDELRIIVEDILQRDLEGEKGIAAVKVKGGLEEEYQVNIDEHTLASLNMDIQQVNAKLLQNNVNIPGGQLYEGETRYMIRTLNEFQSIDDIAAIVIARKGGVDIRLRDIATIEKSHKEREVITLVNGEESIEVEIYKEADANIVEAARIVRNRLFGLPEQIKYVSELDGKKNSPSDFVSNSDPKSGKPQWGQKAKKTTFADHLKLTDFIEYKLPENTKLDVLTDQSIFIEASIEEVKQNAVVGGLIAVAIIFVFLRHLGHTVIIGITIPVSITATFAPMYLTGVSLNIISLGGLALGIGMLVDNSIVVLESIFRCREEGDDLEQATIRGVSEVGGAVFASTLTTIAVFFPIVFVEGVAGQVFGDLSLTVVFSLLASLLVALYFIPMLASRRFQPDVNPASSFGAYWNWAFIHTPFRQFRDRHRSGIAFLRKRIVLGILLLLPFEALGIVLFALELLLSALGKLLEGAMILLIGAAFLLSWIGSFALRMLKPLFWFSETGMKAATAGYHSFLNHTLRARMLVLFIAFAAFACSLYFVYPLIGNELIPETRQGEFYIDTKLPVGTPIEQTARTVSKIEEAIKGDPLIARVATTIGSEKGATSEADEGEHTARITVVMKDGATQEEEEYVIEKARQLASRIPDLSTEIAFPTLFSSKAPIEIELYGYDIDAMKGLSQSAVAAIEAIPGLVDVQSNLQPGSPEVQLLYDRKRISQLGLDLRSVAELVRNKVQGRVPTTFRRQERQIDIRVRLEEADRHDLEDLKKLIVNPRGEFPIQLSSIAQFIVREGPNEIRHLNQQRGTVITANVEDLDLSEATRRIELALDRLDFPVGFSYDITGQYEEMNRSRSSMLLALGLALFLVYIVMASQFESLLHPLIILFTVPLAIIGVLLTLYIGGWSLNILVFIGLIMLAGIVVNNAIVLVDYINILRRRDAMEKTEAIKTACLVRFRPIIMTTLTTVLGITPMALGMGEGSEIRVPLAITVMAGLASSTLLTLIVIPCAYSLIDRERLTERGAKDLDPRSIANESA